YVGPSNSTGTHRARGGARVWYRARGLRGRRAWGVGELACGRAARFHHLLLRGCVHGLAETGDSPEHRHRWRRRLAASDHRLGGAAATGGISVEPCLLFLIIFFWTPPHFWALSLVRVDEYARARLPMLPVVAGAEETRRQILRYSIVLVPIGAAPWLLGYAHAVYGITALIAGVLMVMFAWHVRRKRDGELAERAAHHLFAFSILYLFVLFAVLLIDARIVS